MKLNEDSMKPNEDSMKKFIFYFVKLLCYYTERAILGSPNDDSDRVSENKEPENEELLTVISKLKEEYQVDTEDEASVPLNFKKDLHSLHSLSSQELMKKLKNLLKNYTMRK